MIVFHHVPKSGGTFVVKAVCNGLKNAVKPHGYYRVPYSGEEPHDLEVLAASQGVLASHWCFDPVTRNPKGKLPEGSLYVTWVRDPVAMFFSGWDFYRSPNHAAAQARPARLKEQVELIQQCNTFEEYLGLCVHPGVDCFPMGQVWPGDPVLKVFDFVGRCERMTEDLWTLGRMVGFKPVLLPARENKSKRTVDRNQYWDAVTTLLMEKKEVEGGRQKDEG